MTHEAFISYAAADQQVAEEVCRALEAGGVGCWMAPRDIPPGVPFEVAVVKAISTSPTLILIHSDHANNSLHVMRELRCAFGHKPPKRVIPIRIRWVTYSESLDYYLSSTQWLDASAPPLEAHLRKLVEHLSARPEGVGAAPESRQPVEPPLAESHPPASVFVVPLTVPWVSVVVALLILIAVIVITLARQPPPEQRASPTSEEINITDLINVELRSRDSAMNYVIVEFRNRHLTLRGSAPSKGCREVAGSYSREIAERYGNVEGVTNLLKIQGYNLSGPPPSCGGR